MQLTEVLSLTLLCLALPINTLPVITPVTPMASWSKPGFQLESISCDDTATPVTKALANDTLHRFCADHLGVDIRRGGNFSTYYDTNDTRIYFNVVNQCAPNGVYLPFNACVSGFSTVTRCPASCGLDWTSGGQVSEDCLGFHLNAELVAVNADKGKDDGVVVTCEGTLC